MAEPASTVEPAAASERKAAEQLVQPEPLLQLGPVELAVVVLLQQRHELVLPDPAQALWGSGRTSS